MVATAKLTKRQKKGIAFRQRKQNKSKDEINAPSLEDQVLVTAAQGSQGRQVSAEALVGKGKAGAETETEVVVAARKRKRKAGEEAEGTPESDKPKLKRRKGSERGPLDVMKQSVEDHVRDGEMGEESGRTKRFILFLGNLKYTTTPQAIQTHFSVCDPPPTVRLLTPKPSTNSPTRTVMKSKGCAFLEFKHRSALQQGLKLHHSELDGRQINVELTAGGGGKGSTRMKKVKDRNKELEAQRRKRQDPSLGAHSDASQCFSSTYGMEQTHTRKRTWTANVKETDTHRDLKHQKDARRRKSLAKEFRTGVNAIPVG